MAHTVSIRVLASADDSLRSVFKPFEEAVTGARRKAKSATDGMTADVAKANRARLTSEEKMAQGIAKANEQIAKAESKATDETIKQAKRASDAAKKEFDRRLRDRQKANQAEERDIINTATRAIKAEERALKQGQHMRRQYRQAFGEGAITVGRQVGRTAMNAAHGAGIDLSAQSLVRNHVQTEETVTGAVAQSAMGQGKVATAQDVKSAMDAVKTAAADAKMSILGMAGGLDAFVAESGDVEGAKKMLASMAEVANATGASLEDTAKAGGMLWAKLAGDPQQLEKTVAGLKLFAVQGARGAVEMKQMASLAPRLIGDMNKFAGDPTKNLGQLGAIMQAAKLGGRTSAAEASRTPQAFTSYLAKGPTQDRLDAAGIDVWADAGHTKMIEPKEIIKKILDYTKGDQKKLAELIKDAPSKAAVSSFQDAWNAGGGAGVDKKFADMATSQDAEMTAAANLRKSTTGGMARGLQNQIQGMAGDIFEKALANPEMTMGLAGASMVGGGLINGLINGGGGGLGGLLGGGGGAGGLGGLGGVVPVQVMGIAAGVAAAWFAGKGVIDHEIDSASARDAKLEADKNKIAELGSAVASVDPLVRAGALDELQKRHEENNAAQDANKSLFTKNADGTTTANNSFMQQREQRRLSEEEAEIIRQKKKLRAGGSSEPDGSWTGLSLGGPTKNADGTTSWNDSFMQGSQGGQQGGGITTAISDLLNGGANPLVKAAAALEEAAATLAASAPSSGVRADQSGRGVFEMPFF